MCTRTTGCAMYKLDLSLSVRCIVSCRTRLLSGTSSARSWALGPATGSSSSHSASSTEYHKAVEQDLTYHQTHYRSFRGREYHKERRKGRGEQVSVLMY